MIAGPLPAIPVIDARRDAALAVARAADSRMLDLFGQARAFVDAVARKEMP